MKIKSLFVAVLLMGGVLVAPAQASTQNPIVESFSFTPNEIELFSNETTVNFEAVVSHPLGIENTSLVVTLTNNLNSNFLIYLYRTDSPVNSTLQKVTFKGSVTLPRNITQGVYVPSLSSARNNKSTNYQYETGVTTPKNFRALVGAENGLLIRNDGNLNLSYSTFEGPTYNSLIESQFTNTAKYNASVVPNWRVGEVYKISDYFEQSVPGLNLSISSLTPSVCLAEGTQLKFLSEGYCGFKVSTPKTKDYLEKTYEESVSILPAKRKQSLSISKVENQTVKEFPAYFALPQVYSGSQAWILPTSITPLVCFTSGFSVKMMKSGTCSLTYQVPATTELLASDVYTQSFDVLKEGETVVAPTPVVTPTPVATPTAKPVVKKTITCVKGTKTIKRTAVSPKCPKGYKLKK
jgi:hypothetical protein